MQQTCTALTRVGSPDQWNSHRRVCSIPSRAAGQRSQKKTASISVLLVMGFLQQVQGLNCHAQLGETEPELEDPYHLVQGIPLVMISVEIYFVA